MIAIAITLLVLELAVGTEGSALHRVLDAWPSYLAYVVSFATIGAAWLGHTGITDRLTRATLGLLRINLLVLLFIALVPFPTKLVAEGVHSDQDERVYVTLYGLTLLALRVLLYLLDEYARRKNLFDERGAVRDLVRTNLAAVLVAYGVILAIGLVLPLLAVVLYFVVAVVLIVPGRGIERLVIGRKR
ncbi:MAG: TMEM175 family protein [Actinomycetes bacterium]